jgi:hypothetical protein
MFAKPASFRKGSYGIERGDTSNMFYIKRVDGVKALGKF